MADTKKFLSYEGLQKYDEQAKAAALAAAKEYADDLAGNYDPAGTAATKVNELANGQVATNTTDIEALTKDVGNLEDLGTTSKDDLVGAINEVRNSVSAGGTAAAITIDTSTTTDGALKSYTIKQGSNVVGTIDIPKDMVVQSGEVVVDPEGQVAGTYIKLVLANVTEPLYVNVGTLVDIYKAQQNAAQVQLTIDSSTREISAVLVNGSVGTDVLADGGVTTAKIADGNVTLAKLSTAVQTSLGKADTAVQPGDLVEITDEEIDALFT